MMTDEEYDAYYDEWVNGESLFDSAFNGSGLPLGNSYAVGRETILEPFDEYLANKAKEIAEKYSQED